MRMEQALVAVLIDELRSFGLDRIFSALLDSSE